MKLNNTSLNVLISFAYGRDTTMKYVTELVKKGAINLMIDSGAFTVYTSGKTITVDDYCKFLDKYGEYAVKYVSLDVIHNTKQSKINYEEFLSRGYKPMFVFTQDDEDYDYLKSVVSINKDICVAGGVTNPSWVQRRYQLVYNKTKADIHGLGYVRNPNMFKLPLVSVDSSSWIRQAQQFGILKIFKNNNFQEIHAYKLKKENAIKNRDIAIELELLKVTPKDFNNQSLRGGGSIQSLVTILAFLKYQQYCKLNKLDLYFAASSMEQIQRLEYIWSNYKAGTLTYDEYKRYYSDTL